MCEPFNQAHDLTTCGHDASSTDSTSLMFACIYIILHNLQAKPPFCALFLVNSRKTSKKAQFTNGCWSPCRNKQIDGSW